VKYDLGTAVGKSYYLFDFTGQQPNTNSALTFTATTANNSARQRVLVWALNQPYPGISSTIVYATAQANETNSNFMLTDPTNQFTATLVADRLSVNGANLTQTITIPAPWGQHVFGNKLVLAMTGTNDPAVTSANGFRMRLGTVSLGFQVLSGAPPSVGILTNVVLREGETSPVQAFTVSDPEDGPASLAPLAVSSNENVVSAASVVFGGVGADRTLYFTAGVAGQALVTVTVYDSLGNAGERSFQVTVLPANYAPVVTGLGVTNTMLNTPVTVPFRVEDRESPASALTVSGEVAVTARPC
jgi:hypothetical protein